LQTTSLTTPFFPFTASNGVLFCHPGRDAAKSKDF
jgi:hypothetical protein